MILLTFPQYEGYCGCDNPVTIDILKISAIYKVTPGGAEPNFTCIDLIGNTTVGVQGEAEDVVKRVKAAYRKSMKKSK